MANSWYVSLDYLEHFYFKSGVQVVIRNHMNYYYTVTRYIIMEFFKIMMELLKILYLSNELVTKETKLLFYQMEWTVS